MNDAPKRPNRLRRGAIAGTLAVSLVGGFEGLRQTAYPDPATGGRPWTICYGSAHGVKPGDHKSIEECKALLISDLETYANAVSDCVKAPMPDRRFVALVSFFYNVGNGAACKSSVVRLINQGRTEEGCNALLQWNRAAGVVFPGLTRRRQKEREYCLAD